MVAARFHKPLALIWIQFVILGLAGCNTTEVSESAVTPSASAAVTAASTGSPAWILNPAGPNGELGGVGYARTHVRGVSYQRQLAIARGMEEIARQKGVRVESVLEFIQVDTGVGQASGSTLYSVQTTTGEIIRARLSALWVSEGTGEIYAWLLASE